MLSTFKFPSTVFNVTGTIKPEIGNLTPTESDRFLRSHMRLHVATPNWSFVFDPAGRLCYYWSIIVSLAFLYNFWVIIYRFAFQEINRKYFLLCSHLWYSFTFKTSCIN